MFWYKFLKNRHMKESCLMCKSIYLSIYGSTALFWTMAPFLVSWSFTYSVGLLGWGISPSQGRYLHTRQHKNRIKASKHPCFKWDSNPWSSVWEGEDSSCLRPCGHCDRLMCKHQSELYDSQRKMWRLQSTLMCLFTALWSKYFVDVFTFCHNPAFNMRS
jgi:hypothetical protein